MLRKQNIVQRALQKLAIGIIYVVVYAAVYTNAAVDWLLAKVANLLFGKPERNER